MQTSGKDALYIDTQSEFESFVQSAQEADVLAIDTEFMREKTYYPRLCLLQMATDEQVVIVDPFQIEDLTILSGLLSDNRIMKVFHAGRQDIEIMLREVGFVPHPLFDTQIAATLMGHVQQIGLAALISSIMGIQLKKSDSFTDWARRPLSQSQINYAADDVRYLPQIYRTMSNQLAKTNRLHWLNSDFEALADESKYTTDPRERYIHLKRVSQLSRPQLSAARELAAWREQKAQSCDIPRKWVLTDEQVVEACRREARTIDELMMVRGISEKLSTKDARTVAAAIATGLDLPRNQMPTLVRSQRNEANVDAEVDALNVIVTMRARENNIALQTLASQKELVEVARGHRDVEVLKGWRREIVGNELIAFMEGKLQILCKDGKVVIESYMSSD